MVLANIKTILTGKYFFIQLILSKIPSGLKDHYLTTNLLLLLLLLYILYYNIILYILYYIYYRKFNLKHCLLPITSSHTDYSPFKILGSKH